MLASFELQAMGLLLSCLVLNDKVSETGTPLVPEASGNPYENYKIGEENFFRSTEADDNGFGWDNRLGK